MSGYLGGRCMYAMVPTSLAGATASPEPRLRRARGALELTFRSQNDQVDGAITRARGR